MPNMEVLFWSSAVIVGYTYLGYGLLQWVVLKLRARFGKPLSPPPTFGPVEWPAVTVLIAAYNEADLIAAKIENTLALDYPADKLHLLFVTDGSTDETPQLVARYPQVQLLHQPERRGKIAAVQRAMPLVKTPITVNSDANTFLNREALYELVRWFADPQVGAVAGEKRVWSATVDQASAAGEGLYWKYESWLKKQDAALGTVVGAAGELFAIRTELFERIPSDTIIEDFYQTMRVAQRGFRVAYAPAAYASENASADVGEEIKRKIRIAAGGFQAMGRLLPLLNPWRYGSLTFQYVSHRVLRWTAAPLALPLLLLSNLLLATTSTFYATILAAHLAFYAIALIGYFTRNRPLRLKGFTVPFYFVMMNWCVYLGFIKFLRKNQSVVWDKAKRAAPVLKSS